MTLSPNTGLVIMVLVSLMWGSWFQVVKHTGKYPIVGFIAWLYTFSSLIVWGAIALLHKTMIPKGVFTEIASSPGRAWFVFVCGIVFAVTMQLQLTVVGRIGLILSTSVSATCAILSSAVVSAYFGGLPENVSFLNIIAASVLLILATIICQYAGMKRSGDVASSSSKNAFQGKARTQDILLLIFVNTVLFPFYSLAAAIGIASPLRPGGFSSLTMMGILSLGSLFGGWLFCTVILSVRKQWSDFRFPEKPVGIILSMAGIAAFCHFGGNVLQAVVAPVLSVAVSITLGNSYHMWSYVWGLVYGEFKGASRKTYLLLALGMLLFVGGILLMSLTTAS